MGNKKYWYELDRETNSIGFGCWQITGIYRVQGKPHGWGAVSEEQAIDLLTNALSMGIDFYDTAQGYNAGKSEYLLGQAIAKSKLRPTVCTKVGLTPEEMYHANLDAQFENKVDQSLTRLGTERIDVLLLHNPPDTIDWTTFDYSLLLKLKKKGKIGTFGISSTTIKGAQKAIDAQFGSVVEWVFNLFERRPATDLFPKLQQNKMNFIARSPLSRGLISPKYILNNPQFDEDDFRSTLPDDWLDWVVTQTRRLNNNGVSAEDLTKFSLNYCIQFPEVTSAIVGIRTKKQLLSIAELLDGPSPQVYNLAHSLQGIPPCYPKWK